MSEMFYYFILLSEINLWIININHVIKLPNLFDEFVSLTSFKISSFNSENVVDIWNISRL